MKTTKILVSLVAVFAIVALMVTSVSAFGDIDAVEISGVDVIGGSSLAVFSGQTLPVRVVIDAISDAEDVRVKAWIAGERDLAVSSARFDVIGGNLYSRLMAVTIPSDMDEQHTHRGGLPRTVRTHHTEHLAGLHGEADILHHVPVAEPLPDSTYFDYRHGSRLLPTVGPGRAWSDELFPV